VEAHLPTAHNAFVLIVSERAFIADSHQGSGSDVTIAHWTFAVAFITEAANGDSGLLAAHDKISRETSRLVLLTSSELGVLTGGDAT